VLNTDSYEEQVDDLEPQENNEQEAVQYPTEKEIDEEFGHCSHCSPLKPCANEFSLPFSYTKACLTRY
jgi:hypothetical protein